MLVDANAWTGKRIQGCGDGTVHGAYGRDELNIDGKSLLPFAPANTLALTNPFISKRKDGIYHTAMSSAAARTLNILNTSYPKCIDYTLTRQAHRSRAYDVKVNPQHSNPSQGEFSPLYRIRDGLSQWLFCTQQTRLNDKKKIRPDVEISHRLGAASGGAGPLPSSFPILAQPKRISEMAESFADAIVDAVASTVPPPPLRCTHEPGWFENMVTSAAYKIAWDAREDARCFMRTKKDKTA